MPDESKPEVLATGDYLRLMRIGHWEYVERVNANGAVGIVALTEADELLLVEQFRYAVNNRVIELPAGLTGDVAGMEEEDFAEAAKRELIEETGYSASTMKFLCEGPPSAGATSEIIALYMAGGLTKVGEGGGDHTEDIVVHKIPIAHVPDWLETKRQEGLLVDMRIYTALYFVKR